MNHPYIYTGCFIPYHLFHDKISSIRRNPLQHDVKLPHITFAYKPNVVNEALFGELISVVVTGYGNDGLNEGVKVQLLSNNPTIQQAIDQIDVPHITIAVSDDGKPVNTRNLQFTEIPPKKLYGFFGGYTKWGKACTQKRGFGAR